LHTVSLGHIDLQEAVALIFRTALGIDDLERVLQRAEEIVAAVIAVIRLGIDVIEAVLERAFPDLDVLIVVKVQPAFGAKQRFPGAVCAA
jgi:pentose-5-phosphate-3-epimerase